MLQFARTIVAERTRRARADDRGVVMVEFALVFVLFMIILWGILTFGFVFALKQSLTHAATEAGRVAIDSGAQAEQQARNVVTSELSWLGDQAQHVTTSATTVPCDYEPARSCLLVDVSYPWKAQPIIPSIFGIVAPDTLRSQSTIQLRG